MCLLLVLDYVVAAVRPGDRDQVWLWYTVTHPAPIWFVGSLWVASVSVTFVLAARAGSSRRRTEVLLVVECTAFWWATKISPMTGDQVGWFQGSRNMDVALSEPLADFVHKIPYLLTHDLDAVRFVSPVFGTLAIVCFLVLARRISSLTNTPLWMVQAFFTATPLWFWFFSNYVENTFLGIPAILLAINSLLKWLESPHTDRRSLIEGFAFLALATTFHVEFIFLLLSAGLFVLLRPAASWRVRLVGLGLAVISSLVIPAVVLSAIALLGGKFFPGNTGGGYGGQILVPFSLHPGERTMSTFTFFSHPHLIQVANIVVHAAPALVVALPVLAVIGIRKPIVTQVDRWVGERNADSMLLLASLTIGYLAFVCIWGFDLGQVGDLDLMLTMDVPLCLYAFCLLARRLERKQGVLMALIVATAFINVLFYAMKVANIWQH